MDELHVRFGGNADHRDMENNTPVHNIVRVGDARTAKIVLNSCAEINTKQEQGFDTTCTGFAIRCAKKW